MFTWDARNSFKIKERFMVNTALTLYYLMNGFSHLIIWVSPLSFLGVLGVIFISFFYEISLCKQHSPRCDATFCSVTSGAMLFAYVPQKGRQF